MARLLIVEDNPELAALVAAVAQTRGHEVHTAFTGEAALEALGPTTRFDAALVDLLLPDIRGSEVLGALRAHGIPAVAVSGVYKGDRFAQEAVHVHGAGAFFEKPFELDAVLAALEEAAGVPPVSPGQLLDDADLLVLEELVQEEEPALEAALSAAAPPGPAPTAAPTSHPEDEAPSQSAEAELSEALPLPFGRRDAVWTDAAPVPAVPPRRRQLPEWSLAGDLARTRVPRLLNAYYEARHHGELKLRQGTVLKVVYFEAGRVVYAASNLAPERFGRFCLRRGALTEPQLAEATAYAREHSLRTGDALLKRGLLSPRQRRQLLEDQVKDILWSTFGWTEGDYVFSPMRPQRADLVPLSLFPGDLILEGVSRTQTLVALRQRMPPGRRLVPTAAPPYGLHELKLSGGQALLLAFADGSKTVEDLLTLTDLSEREALATLHGLELSGVLEERQPTPQRRERISFGL